MAGSKKEQSPVYEGGITVFAKAYAGGMYLHELVGTCETEKYEIRVIIPVQNRCVVVQVTPKDKSVLPDGVKWISWEIMVEDFVKVVMPLQEILEELPIENFPKQFRKKIKTKKV